MDSPKANSMGHRMGHHTGSHGMSWTGIPRTPQDDQRDVPRDSLQVVIPLGCRKGYNMGCPLG